MRLARTVQHRLTGQASWVRLQETLASIPRRLIVVRLRYEQKGNPSSASLYGYWSDRNVVERYLPRIGNLDLDLPGGRGHCSSLGNFSPH